MSRNTGISLRDVYEVVNRLEEKFDERLADHEMRIRASERFINKALAIAGLGSAFVSLAASYIWEKIMK
jgi:hypothetical protein